ncbi:hypothetical protein [Streptomyces sp. UG1]|uniref:hypothetical protein n=1 Tax=Streptomyces sp. UG1 TaxID=3417652 RepID=UPI003CF29227
MQLRRAVRLRDRTMTTGQLDSWLNGCGWRVRDIGDEEEPRLLRLPRPYRASR